MMDLASDIASLVDDIQDFNIEKDVRTSLKTQEELEKLTVDETLNEIDRSVFLLSSGQEVQCISVVRSLPHLIKGWQNECIKRVIPKVKELLQTAGFDIQLAAIDVFVAVAKDNLLSTPIYVQHFLRTIITNINTKDSVTSQAWLDCLVSVISFLPPDITRREVLGLAIAKGQLSQSTTSRLACCSILGAVASKFESSVVKKDMAHTVKQLCQDVEHNVRACMCTHLHTIAVALGAEETKKSLLEEILELARDEEIQVREAALEALLNITSLLDDETLAQGVVPLVCKFCEQSIMNEDSTTLCVAKHFGKICYNLSANFSTEQREWLLAAFRQLCKLGRAPLDTPIENLGDISISMPEAISSMNSNHGDPENENYLICRRQSAYNFPAVTLFCTANLFQVELLDSLSLLSTDPDTDVRKRIAAGLHEIAQALEAQAHLVHSHLMLLLREKKSPAVLELCLKRLPDTLTAVVIRGNLADNKVNGVAELIGALLSAVTQLEDNWPSAWRPLETLVTHFRRLPDVLTSDQIYYKFVPRVFKLLTTNRYLPVREAAACSVCVFIRHNKKMDQRREMCARLVEDLCYSSSCRNRILFFTVCRHMMVLFSRSFFKETLFEHVLQLFSDPVPNVRLCLCKILPSLKALLKLPRDRGLHGNLETNVRKLLSSEKDRDVSATIRQIIADLDRINVAMESFTQNPLEVDLQDLRKEEEERLLIEKEEKARDEDARSLRSHGSSHSSSSVGKSIKATEKNSKKKRLTTMSTSTLKVNGNKEKVKSLQHLTVPGATDALNHKDGDLSTSSPSISSLYNASNSNSSQQLSRNVASHFAHTTYLSSANNPSAHGPSTALGHKGPHYQSLSQSRSVPSAGSHTSSSFLSSNPPPNHPLSSPSSTINIDKQSRKPERRKTSATPNSGSSTPRDIKDSLPTEPRSRKESTGSASSSGSSSKPKPPLALKKGSMPSSPVPAIASKNKRDKANR